MRVLHLVPSIGPFSGGIGASALGLAGAQRNAGLQTCLWSSDDRAPADGLDRVSLPVFGPRRFAFSPAGERRGRSTQVDVVHQHGLWTAQSRITAVFRTRRIPAIVAPHGSLAPYARRRSWWRKRLALAWFESKNLRLASCLHATSEQEARDLRDFGLRAPVAIIPNAVPVSWLHAGKDGSEFRQIHNIDAATRVMLFVSRVHPIKGLPLLIEAIAMQRDRLRNWRLIIAGHDAVGHRADVEALAERSGVAGMIQFVGNVLNEEKRGAFAAADLFVLPSHTENFGIVVAEALACGIPVITTQAAPWRELQLHNCGWWVPVTSQALAAGLADATTRTVEELRAMGVRGRALIESSYVWPIVAERTIALYRWLSSAAQRPEFVVVD